MRLRKDLELFANLRPAICFKELANASTLKPEVVSDLDIMIGAEFVGMILLIVYVGAVAVLFLFVE